MEPPLLPQQQKRLFRELLVQKGVLSTEVDWRHEEEEDEEEEERDEAIGDANWTFPEPPLHVADEDEYQEARCRYLLPLYMEKLATETALREGLRWMVTAEGDNPDDDPTLVRRPNLDPLEGFGSLDELLEKIKNDREADERRKRLRSLLVWLGVGFLDAALGVVFFRNTSQF